MPLPTAGDRKGAPLQIEKIQVAPIKHAVDDVVDARNVFSRPHETRVEYELRPTDAGPVPLGPEITALEKELEDRGYRVALNHYHQAVDSFSQHRYEASNSQLRAMFEDLLVQLAEAHTDFSKPSDQGGGGQALGKLIGTPSLGPRAGGKIDSRPSTSFCRSVPSPSL